MKEYKRIKAVVDLDAIESNMDNLYNNTSPGTKVIGVIKTDGYGHGAIPIAKVLEEKEYMWGFAVATAEEALILRKNDIELPVLILGYSFPDSLYALIENEVRLTVYSFSMAKEISDRAKALNVKAYIHIKIDTGMSRIGFPSDGTNIEDTFDEILKIKSLPNLCLEGMFTHFAKADEAYKQDTRLQKERYDSVKRGLKERNLEFSLYHCANSAAIIDLPEYNLDAVRAGIALYGLYPSEDVNKDNVFLKPALSLISHAINVNTLDAGVGIGYGGTFVTSGKTKVVTVPVGYGDGYPRSLSNKGYVLINGKKAPIIGRVCMDQFMVDATGIEVSIGDEVTLVGENNGRYLGVDELSRISGRFNYEFVCDLGKRIPREYLRNGKVVMQTDNF